nr:MAG TPA: hypothetical protein [Caudoviricetes sp.]
MFRLLCDNLIIHQGIVYKQHICYYRFEIVINGHNYKRGTL